MKILKVIILVSLLTCLCFAAPCPSYLICPIDGQRMFPGGQRAGPGGQHEMEYVHTVYLNDPTTGRGGMVTHTQWVACD